MSVDKYAWNNHKIRSNHCQGWAEMCPILDGHDWWWNLNISMIWIRKSVTHWVCCPEKTILLIQRSSSENALQYNGLRLINDIKYLYSLQESYLAFWQYQLHHDETVRHLQKAQADLVKAGACIYKQPDCEDEDGEEVHVWVLFKWRTHRYERLAQLNKSSICTEFHSKLL